MAVPPSESRRPSSTTYEVVRVAPSNTGAMSQASRSGSTLHTCASWEPPTRLHGLELVGEGLDVLLDLGDILLGCALILVSHCIGLLIDMV